MAAETGKNFTTRDTDGWYTQYYRHTGSTLNLYMGFKAEYVSDRNIKITFGLINPASSSYQSYNATGSSENYVTVNGTKIVLGSYSYRVKNTWLDTGKTWTITLNNGGPNGNTQIDIAYSMAMHNSCFPDGASGIIRIPAGLVPAAAYCTVKYYDSGWKDCQVYYYTGSAWQLCDLSYYDGGWKTIGL